MEQRTPCRKQKSLSLGEAIDMLRATDHGVLATIGADGFPYAVPLNHVLIDDALYIHCALEGHKLDNIAHEPRVSYCVIQSAEADPVGLTTRYRSTIVFGHAMLIEDAEEKCMALEKLVQRSGRACNDEMKAYIAGKCARVAIVRIAIESISAKSNLQQQ